MPDRKSFDTLYTKLNPAQREAVDAIEGPVMVIAGPGTGKTQILTLRIANILKHTDTPPDGILALTFTNAAAANMRTRLVSIIGADAFRVSIFTFHSFANHLIERHPERFGAIAGATNASEVEQIDIIRGLLAAGRFEALRPLGEPFRFVPEILSAIGHLKKEGFTPDAFAQDVARERKAFAARDDLVHTRGPHKGKPKAEAARLERALAKNEELALLYGRYQEELMRRRRFDFDDALLFLIRALEESEEFLRELQETYLYVLVDEHQDTSGAQNKILELLVSFFDSPNLFVVGDEKQAIFRFQGASLANFLYFEKKFRGVRRITLSENYRSHQGILDAAHSLIAHAREGIPAPLSAHGGVPAKIALCRFDAEDEELLFVAESAARKIKEGIPAHEIAVLYRTNRDALPLRDYFERLRIPCIVENRHGVLDDRDIHALNMLLTAINDLENDDMLAKIFFVGFLHVAVSDAYMLIKEAKRSNKHLFRLLRAPQGLELEHEDAVRALGENLIAWKRASENEHLLYFFERVVRESGFLEHIGRTSGHIEKFDKLVQLFDELKALTARHPFFTLADYLSHLAILAEHRLTLEAEPRRIEGAVRLMTAHKAKGLEFDCVFVPGVYDGHWGSRRSRAFFHLPSAHATRPDEDEGTEDERRLFYVALTRARREVFVSWSMRAPDGRERVPSQFIAEIAPELAETFDASAFGVAGKRPPLFVPRPIDDLKERYTAFVRAHFAEQGFSATSLNNFLRCPWRWFYRDFFRRQFVKTVHQKRGTAVHAALEAFFEKRNHVPKTGVLFLLKSFREALVREDLDEAVFERLLRDGSAHLKGWHDARRTSWPVHTKNEFRVKGVLLSPKDEVRLSGVIDRMDLLDERGHEVRVIDYKTGKPKSRNEIERKTQAEGAGEYKRQLVFYRLLLDRFENGRYRMGEGVLDFIEPTQSGAFKQEAFVIGADETHELEEDIRRAAEAVQALSFWDVRCGREDCEDCVLRDMM